MVIMLFNSSGSLTSKFAIGKSESSGALWACVTVLQDKKSERGNVNWHYIFCNGTYKGSLFFG